MTGEPVSLGRMIDHLAWADQRVTEALAKAESPPSTAVTLLAHVVAAEHIWYARLTGVAPTHPVWPALSIADAATLGRETVAGFRALIASMTSDDLSRDVTYTNSAGARFTTPAIDILLHVCLHGAYHRGQIAAAIRQSGGVPISTDYIEFVRGAAAPARAR